MSCFIEMVLQYSVQLLDDRFNNVIGTVKICMITVIFSE